MDAEPARFSITIEPAPGALVAELTDTEGNVTGWAVAPHPDWRPDEDGRDEGAPWPEGWTQIGATDG